MMAKSKAEKAQAALANGSSGPHFDFEQPLLTIQSKIEELRRVSIETGVNFDAEIDKLAQQAQAYREELYRSLGPAEKLQIARHPQRPNVLEIIQHLSPDTWFELHGDRAGSDDHAMIGGIMELNGRPTVVVGMQKGRTMKDNLKYNFGMPNPEGYRKALRLFYHAQKFGMPVLTLIDTPGAYPGIAAEQHGIGHAIAFNIREMSRLGVPVVSLVTGEGCSGGALGIGVSNEIYMMEHALYTVISPEGCASILWRDATFATQAAESLKITAQDLLGFGFIEGIVPEPLGGAHYDTQAALLAIESTLNASFTTLNAMSAEALRQQRYDKFRKMGAIEEKLLASSK